ncbi:hypothetical protein CCACVL1_07043 [Corchorus capsularis]|uniref:CUB domain-containing protein n=1 Tax=Corchorus capsularis TaxID=210143 RepID=A0A1R3JA93_COCAP|nr:hypothetical protein CCACVL1_07043 [Corchorus capsularis]
MDKAKELQGIAYAKHGQNMDQMEVDSRILTDLLGNERHGRMRGFGAGPTPTSVFENRAGLFTGSKAGRTSSEVQKLREEFQASLTYYEVQNYVYTLQRELEREQELAKIAEDHMQELARLEEERQQQLARLEEQRQQQVAEINARMDAERRENARNKTKLDRLMRFVAAQFPDGLQNRTASGSGSGSAGGNLFVNTSISSAQSHCGGGLGKYEQGIITPVLPKLRSKNQGLGFNYDSNEESDTECIFQNSARRGENYITITMDDYFLLEKQDDCKVINIMPMPELQHNLRLIIGQIEVDVERIDEELSNERDTAVGLQEEIDKLRIGVAMQKQELDESEQILGALLSLENEYNLLGLGKGKLTDHLGLDMLAKCFEKLQRQYPNYYNMYDLSCIASSYALPFVYNNVSELGSASKSRTVLLAVSNYSSTWDIVRQPEPMLRFLDLWENLLPSSILDIILDTIVVPKLSSAIDTWNPRYQRNYIDDPIHLWVHPWLPILGQKLHSKIWEKLSEFDPCDEFAITMLSPWKAVFDPVSWEHLMHRCVVPTLQLTLQGFLINPAIANQKWDQFDWVMSWASVIPIHVMVDLLLKFFFSRWLLVLYDRLLCSNCKLEAEEVINWHIGWKGHLAPELLANQSIRHQLSLGLHMMNEAAHLILKDGISSQGLKEKLSYDPTTSEQRFQSRAAEPKMPLRQVVEAYAQRHNLPFKPKFGRMHDGQQIYAFGNISIKLDPVNDNVYALKDQAWSLVSLSGLVKMQNHSLTR